MKVLHYLFGIPPVRKGGTPTYTLDLVKEQNKLGIQTTLLMPGRFTCGSQKKVRIIKSKCIDNIKTYKIINPLPIPNGYGISEPKKFMVEASVSIYSDFLALLKIEVIHVHSLMGIHKAFFDAAKSLKIPIIYTTHDFYGLCPKIDLLNENELCNSFHKWGKCEACCVNAYSIQRLMFEHSRIYEKYCKYKVLSKMIRKIKKNITIKNNNKTNFFEENKIVFMKTKEFENLHYYYKSMLKMIDFFHFNSIQTKNIFEMHLGKLKGDIINILNKGISDQRELKSFSKVLKIGFLGDAMRHKGYNYLLSVLDEFDNNREFELHIFFESDIKRKYVKEHNSYQRNELKDIFLNFDLLVVPSICYETFGMVTLEALSFGVPVFISDRVGSKQILEENKGCGRIFSIENRDLYGLIEELFSYRSILVNINQNIMESNLKFDFNRHVCEIINIYNVM